MELACIKKVLGFVAAQWHSLLVDEVRWRAAMDHISEGVQISALNALRSWILYYGLNEGKDWLRNTDFSEKSGRSRKVCWLGQGLKVELLR
jgi:hypothetical protein